MRWQDKAWPVHAVVHAAVSTGGAIPWNRWRDRTVAKTIVDCIGMGRKEISWPWKMNLKEYGIHAGEKCN
jgi:hypothetical protein